MVGSSKVMVGSEGKRRGYQGVSSNFHSPCHQHGAQQGWEGSSWEIRGLWEKHSTLAGSHSRVTVCQCPCRPRTDLTVPFLQSSQTCRGTWRCNFM